jgi:predicted secreted protein
MTDEHREVDVQIKAAAEQNEPASGKNGASPGRKSRNRGVVILAIVVCLFVAGIGWYYFTTRNKESIDDTK